MISCLCVLVKKFYQSTVLIVEDDHVVDICRLCCGDVIDIVMMGFDLVCHFDGFKFTLIFFCEIISFWTLLSREIIKEIPLLKGARKDAFWGSRKVGFSLGERCQLFER